MFGSYEEIKKDLRVKLIPIKGNEKLLEDAVYRQMEDLALIYRACMSEGEECSIYIVIRKQEIERWGITEDQLHEDAMQAANDHGKLFIMSISQMLGMANEDGDELLYVVSTKDQCGAWAIFYPGAMKAYSWMLKADGYYILPSSVHEVLLCTGKGMTGSELRQIVCDVNQNVVQEDERLTNSVYYYDAGDDVFRKVC